MQVLLFCELSLKTPIHAPKLEFLGQNRGKGGAMLTSNELVLTFRGCLLPLCHFWQKSIKKCDRESADTQIDRRTHTVTETN